MSDILVFGTMGEIGTVAEESLKKHHLDVVRVDFPQNTLRDEPGYVRTLKKAIEQCHPKMILPVGCTIAISRTDIPDAIFVPVGNENNIVRLESKTLSSALATELGIPQPRFFKDAADAQGTPVIFKRDNSFGGSGVYRPRTVQALQNLIDHEKGGKFLIEEYICGQDRSVDAIRWNGYFRAECYQSVRQLGGQGPALEREKVEDQRLCLYARTILDAIDYQGVCGMDFRIDNSGRAYFLECNPRLTGGIALQIKTGFDIPFLLWSMMEK